MKTENGDSVITTKQLEHHKPTLFDEAITMTGFGKFNLFLIVFTGVVLTITIYETLYIISFVLPVAQCDLQLTTQDKGILSSIGFLGVIVSSHLWGFLADLFGRKKVIQITLFLNFVITVISSFANEFWFLLIFRFLNGFFVSGSSATIYAYLSEFHSKKNLSRAVFGSTVIFGVGCVLFPLFAWTVLIQKWEFYIPFVSILFKPWRLLMASCGFLSLICAIIIMILPESPKFVLLGGDQLKAIRILQKIYEINNGKSQTNINITSIVDENSGLKKQHKDKHSLSTFLKLVWDQTAPLFYKSHLRISSIACFMQFGTFVVSHGLVMWFPTIANIIAEYTNKFPEDRITICEILLKTDSFSPNQGENSTSFMDECSGKLDIASYTNSFYSDCIFLAGVLVSGFIVDYFGKLSIMLLIFIPCGVSGIIMTYITSPIIALILLIILLQSGVVTPVITLASVELYPTNLRAMAICIILMCGRLGSVVGSNLVGYLLKYNCSGTFRLCSADLLVCAFLAFFIPNIFRKSEKQPITTDA